MVVPILGKVADTYSLDLVFLILVAIATLCALGAFLLKDKPSKTTELTK